VRRLRARGRAMAWLLKRWGDACQGICEQQKSSNKEAKPKLFRMELKLSTRAGQRSVTARSPPSHHVSLSTGGTRRLHLEEVKKVPRLDRAESLGLLLLPHALG
jgi:hypothetical protein